MATINFARREIEAKIVYVGPALSGKTTNVQVLHRLVPRPQRGELHSLSTDGDRTLFFDFIPVELGQIAGFTAHFKLFTVPGQVYYQQTRKAVLQGADGVVFVADSSAGRAQANLDAMIDLEQNLRAHGLDLASIPLVVQLNKRDVEDALPVSHMSIELNPFGVPTVESIAASGYGVLDTLYKITEIATKRIRENLSGQKNAVRLQAVQKEERESEQQVVDEYLTRIHKVRPEEEASAERMKAAGRMRPDDVDSFLLEFVDRDDELLLDDSLPAAPEDHRPRQEPPARTSGDREPRADQPAPGPNGVGAPPVFSAAEAKPQPATKSTRRSERRARPPARTGASQAAPLDERPTAEEPRPVAAEVAAPPAEPRATVPPPRPTPSRPPEPRESRPAEPAPLRADSRPADPRPPESSPVEPRPEPRAAEPGPVETRPAGPVESRPVETRAESRPVESRPVETRPAESRPVESRPVESPRSPSKPRYPEGPVIEAHVDAHLLAGVLLREVLGSNVGADGRATIEVVLERDGVARRHPLRFVESAPQTPWGAVTIAGITALTVGFLGGMLVGWQFL